MKNIDKIKLMTSDKLSEFLVDRIMSCDGCPVDCKIKHIGYKKCPKQIRNWLESEATE